MSELSWFDFVFGKFYSSGRVYYDSASEQFKDVTDLNLHHVPAYFCANSLLNKNYVCGSMPDQLPMELAMALPKLKSGHRDLLLQKFDLAWTTLRKLNPNVDSNNPVRARVIVSRKGTSANYTSDNSMFVYIIGDQAEDQFYFAQSVKPRDADDNRLYIYFLFEGDCIEKY